MPRNTTIQIRLSPEERAEIDTAAKRAGLTSSEYVRRAVRRAIDGDRLIETIARREDARSASKR